MDTTETQPNRTSRRSRRQPQRRRSIADRWGSIGDGLLVVVVAGSALAIGTVHIPVLLAFSALALIGATFELMTSLRRVPRPAVVLTALGLFSALQAISFPAAWVKRLSPVSAEVWLRCLVPFGEPALRSFPFSLDPSASVAEALKWLTYASVYVMAVRTRARRGSAWLAVLLFGSAALVSLITLVHGIADLPELYGVYHPDFAPGRWNVGPLLNSNNLAGYAILGLFTGGGLLLSGRSPLPRLASMIGIGSITAALALSGSRAALLSILVAGFVALVWLLRAKGARISSRGLALAIAPLAIGIGIAVALGTGEEAGQFTMLDVERKASVWLWSLPMIRDHALFGVGRGAFETAFPPYRGALDYDWAIVVSHAENFVIQWIAEWGAPIGVCAVLLIVGYVLREWYGSRGDRLRFMVLTGVLALFFQNFADLGLEVPALAIAAVLALAAGERPTAAASVESTDAPKRVGRRIVFGSIPALAIWAVAMVWSRSPAELERRELSAAYRELSIGNANQPAIPKADELAQRSADDLEMRRVGELTTDDATVPATGGADALLTDSADELSSFRARLHQAVLRHPGEAFFPLLGSLVAMRVHERNALTWVGRALELAPTNGPVHLILADLMHSHGATTQAMMHLRLASQYDRTLGGAVGARAPVWAPSIDLLMQAIPDGPYGQEVLLAACAKEHAIELKLDCLRRAAMRSPGSAEAHLALAESLLSAIKAAQLPCKDSLIERCAAEAEAASRSAARLDPKAWRPGYLLSKVLLARGDAAGAAKLLTRTCPQNIEGDECWREALVVAMKGGADDATSTAANALAARECDGMESCGNMFTSLASVLDSGGQLALASKFYIKAAEAEPSAVRWLKVAEFAARAHLNGVARAALERANHSFDASPTTRAEVELLRQRVEQPASGPTN